MLSDGEAYILLLAGLGLLAAIHYLLEETNNGEGN